MRRLAGVNLGGFFSQVRGDLFSDAHLDTFLSEQDLGRIRQWGFNSVRLPVDSCFFEIAPFQYDTSRLKRIDSFLSLAEKNGLTVVLDLHKAPGHSFDAVDRSANDIWDRHSENRKRFLQIWSMLSKRCASREHLIHEIMNEPVADRAEDWNELCEETIAVIRANDRAKPIVVESNLWGICRQFPELRKFRDDGIIYSFHFYEPMVITHQFAPWVAFVNRDIYRKRVAYPGRPDGIAEAAETIAAADAHLSESLRGQDQLWNAAALERCVEPVLAFQRKHQVPIYCGEFGCVVLADPETRKNWTTDVVRILAKHEISFAYWSYKNMGFGLVDDTERHKDNPNYGRGRLDQGILSALQGGIL
jgi:endoglucanase